MDKRIGYGLDLRKAIEIGLSEATQQGQVSHFSISTKDHLIIWGELRDDGWRVYAPKSIFDSSTSTKIGDKNNEK